MGVKVLSLRLETQKHCLKGDKLGNVLICISYLLTLKNRSFLQNFTRLHLVTRTFYFRLIAIQEELKGISDGVTADRRSSPQKDFSANSSPI